MEIQEVREPREGLRNATPASDTAPVALRIRSHDWAATPLGSMERWPQSLRTAVNILLSSRYAMWMAWGPELTFLCNDAYRPTLGIKDPWALGASARAVWAEIWPDIGPRIDAVLSTGEATYDEGLLLFLERSGFPEETYHTFSYSPLMDDSGRISGMLCVVTEETERVIGERRVGTLRDISAALAVTNAEQEVLAALQEQLGHNTRDLPFALTYLFEDGGEARLAGSTGIGRNTPLAPEFLEAGSSFPWPAAGILLHPAPRIVDDLSTQNLLGRLPGGAWNKAPQHAVVVPIKRQGQERPAGFLVAGINPFRRYDAPYEGFIGLLAGQIAAALANARAYEAERKRAQALAEIDRAKTAFFSNVSHEFRTPLTLLLGPLEELLAKPAPELPASSAALVEVVHRNALRLLRLVNSLLDFASLESGRANATYEPVNLSRFTADLASSFRSTIEKAGLRFEVDCPDLPEAVYVDPDMWEKVVLNLLSNALKFTFQGEIRVSVRAVESAVELSVGDTGTGIPPSELPLLFTRFHRVRGAVGRTNEGTGIGLALVQEIVRQHGGSIRVDSRPGEGSLFTVSIPSGKAHLPPDRIGAPRSRNSTSVHAHAWVQEALRWSPELPADPAAPTSSDGPAPNAAPGDARVNIAQFDAAQADIARVYIAEDNADMREYLGRLLAKTYRVSLFVDGLEALHAVRAHPPDLLLSDVMMPRMNGFELLHAVRADPALSEVRVILLSARAGEESKIGGLEAGADDYLVKPFTTAELLARVRAHIQMARSRRQAEARLREAQKLESIGLLAGGVAHDFNNLLVGVIGNASLLLDCFALEENARSCAEDVLRAGQTAANLTQQLLAYAGKGKIATRQVDLSRLVHDTKTLLESTIPKEVSFHCALEPELACIEGDPTQIQQLVMNLVINGAEAIGAHAPGQIHIRTRAGAGQVILEVTDSGAGMSPDVASRIFEPFFTTKFSGRGLGLAAVQGIVRSHRGTLDLRTSPGAGSTFTVTFPVANRGAESEIPAHPDRAAPASQDLSGSGTILVVDDEPSVREVARNTLERRGYTVALADSGDAAIHLIQNGLIKNGPLKSRHHGVDLILLDWAMPGKNGEKTLEVLRQICPTIPVLLSTGFNQAEARQYFHELAGFLQKPYTSKQLAAAVKEALHGKKPGLAPAAGSSDTRRG